MQCRCTCSVSVLGVLLPLKIACNVGGRQVDSEGKIMFTMVGDIATVKFLLLSLLLNKMKR